MTHAVPKRTTGYLRMARQGSPTSPFVKRTAGTGWATYSQLRNTWIKAHPNATAAEIDAASRRIATRLGL